MSRICGVCAIVLIALVAVAEFYFAGLKTTVRAIPSVVVVVLALAAWMIHSRFRNDLALAAERARYERAYLPRRVRDRTLGHRYRRSSPYDCRSLLKLSDR